ncbi:helix-turn-helix transcriptional regulator [Pseudonocardia eucalypti]|uniref:Helix-turn-helix transcriptional regulator n=2 Tax=Pseudonocardia eucalypti TaxID=648755 RepID=A0ABP9Q591_9PSEU
MLGMVVTTQPTVGDLLRKWRQHRRLSQLDLSIQADISTRHLSFVETGRSAPSRDMVMHLAEQLDLPLRERNQMLMAAGYAPVYQERALDTAPMAVIRDAVRQVLLGHEPYPAIAVDRQWNLVDGNAALPLMLAEVDPALLEQPANALRISLHPDGMAPRIANLGEWRGHLLGRLRRQVEHTADLGLSELLEELLGYPCADEVPLVEHPGPGDVVVPLRLCHESGELAFFSTVTTFGTPLDVTVAELAIEAFFPANQHTTEILRTG